MFASDNASTAKRARNLGVPQSSSGDPVKLRMSERSISTRTGDWPSTRQSGNPTPRRDRQHSVAAARKSAADLTRHAHETPLTRIAHGKLGSATGRSGELVFTALRPASDEQRFRGDDGEHQFTATQAGAKHALKVSAGSRACW